MAELEQPSQNNRKGQVGGSSKSENSTMTFFGKLRRRIKRKEKKDHSLTGGAKSDAKPDTPSSGTSRKKAIETSPKSTPAAARTKKAAPSSPTSVTASLEGAPPPTPPPPPPPRPKKQVQVPPAPPNPREQVLPRSYRQQIQPTRSSSSGNTSGSPVVRLNRQQKTAGTNERSNDDVPFDEQAGGVHVLDMKEVPPPEDSMEIPGRTASFEAQQNENGDVEISVSVDADAAATSSEASSSASATVAVVSRVLSSVADRIVKSTTSDASLPADDSMSVRAPSRLLNSPTSTIGSNATTGSRRKSGKRGDPGGVKWTEDPGGVKWTEDPSSGSGGKWTEVKSVPRIMAAKESDNEEGQDFADDQSSLHVAEATDWTMAELEETIAQQDGEMHFDFDMDDDDVTNSFIPHSYMNKTRSPGGITSIDFDEEQGELGMAKTSLTAPSTDYTSPSFDTGADISTRAVLPPSSSRFQKSKRGEERLDEVSSATSIRDSVSNPPSAAASERSAIPGVLKKPTFGSPPSSPVQTEAKRPYSPSRWAQRGGSPIVTTAATATTTASTSCLSNGSNEKSTQVLATTGCSPRSLRLSKRLPASLTNKSSILMPKDETREEQVATPSSDSVDPPALTLRSTGATLHSNSNATDGTPQPPTSPKQIRIRLSPTLDSVPPPMQASSPRRNMASETLDRYAPAKSTLRNARSMLSSDDDTDGASTFANEEKKEDDSTTAEYMPLHGSRSYSTQNTDDNDSTFNFQEEEDWNNRSNQRQIGNNNTKTKPKASSQPQVYGPPGVRGINNMLSDDDDDDPRGGGASSSRIVEEVVKRKKKMKPSKSTGNLGGDTSPRKTLATRRSRSDASFASSILTGIKSFEDEDDQHTHDDNNSNDPPALQNERRALQRLRNTMRRRRKQQKDTRPHRLYEREEDVSFDTSYDASTYGSSVGTGTTYTQDTRGTDAKYSVYSALQEYDEDERSSIVTSGSDEASESVSEDEEEDYPYINDSLLARAKSKKKKKKEAAAAAASTKRHKEPSLTQELSDMGTEFRKDPSIIMEWMNLR